MLDHQQLSPAGGDSLSALHLSLLSDTTSSSWLDATAENLLKNSNSSSANLFEDSMYRSFVRAQGGIAPAENLDITDCSFFEDTSTFTRKNGSQFSSSTDDASQISSSSRQSSSYHHVPSKFLDSISINHNDFSQMRLNSITADTSSIFLGRNPLTFYEPLPASLKGSGSSLNKVKRFLAAIKASHYSMQPPQKDFSFSVSQKSHHPFLDDDYSIEKIKAIPISTHPSRKTEPHHKSDNVIENANPF